MPLRTLRAGLWGLVGVAVVGVALVRVLAFQDVSPTPITVPGAAQGVDGGVALGARRAPDFALTDQFGQRVSLSAFRHGAVVLAFIDSRCTTVCPLTAQTLADAKRLMGRAGRGVQLLAVNASPVATSVADVRAWSSSHGMLDRWLFLTGPVSDLKRVWRAYAVSVRVIDGQVDHTPAVYVIAPGLREAWAFETTGAPSNIPDQAYVVAENLAKALGLHVEPRPPSTLVPVAAVLGAPSGAAAFRLAGFTDRGQRTVVTVGGGHGALVDFFATWCHACAQDLRILNAYARLREREPGLPPVIGVDLRIAEPSTAYVRGFLLAHGVDFPVGLDATAAVFDRYGVTALPSNFLVSTGGRILWSHVGLLPLSGLVSAVLRAEQRPAPRHGERLVAHARGSGTAVQTGARP